MTPKEFQEMLQKMRNNALTTICLRDDAIGKKGVIALSHALKINTSLTSIYLIGNAIGDNGAIALSDALKTNSSLTTIYLINNAIGDNGAIALSDALKTNNSLTTLYLSYNAIGENGAIALSDALKTNTSLTTIDLTWNKISENGAIALSDALKTNASLTTINLSCNAIGDNGAIAFSHALKTNTALTRTSLWYNAIGDNGAIAFSHALKINTSLTDIDLSCNAIGGNGATALSHALKINTSLTDIDLSCNAIGDNGATALSHALKINTSLTTIGINEYLEKFIAEQVSKNKRNAEALIAVAKNGDLVRVQQLVQQKVSINHHDYDGNTALHYAAAVGNQSIVDYLLAQPRQRILRNAKNELPKGIFVKPIANKSTPQSFLFGLFGRSSAKTPQAQAAFEPKAAVITNQELRLTNPPIELGRGGFGIVYQGTWQHNKVAIKKLFLASPTQNTIEEFKHETQLMAQINHPNVIRLYGMCLEPNQYSMVLEYMPKGSLYNLIHDRAFTFSWQQRWHIAMDIGQGVLHLHSRYILHRDLKSHNVLLDAHYRAKVSDFGLSRLRLETQSLNNLSNQMVGTPASSRHAFG